MKRLLHRSLVLLALSLLAASACTELLPPDNLNKVTVPVRFRVRTSDDVPLTKSDDGLIRGTDAEVTVLYMYCFDENGRYLGRFNATDLTSTYDTNEPNDEGTFQGQVPPATARIHFVANANIPVGNDKIGMTEEDIFHGQTAQTWGIAACRRDQIAYWGYHKEATAKAMADLLDPNNTTTTTIYLLRDRARIEAGTFSSSLNPTYDPDRVQWTIYNCLSTGYVAPYDATNHSFGGYYTTTGGLKSTAPITPQANPARDKTDDADLRPFTEGSYMYSFEDRNLINGNDVSKAIRIIVKVKIIGEDEFLYFPVRLTDKEGNDQLHIARGHRYQLNLGYLPVGLGYGTFAEAAAATSFANGQLVSIPMVVPEVSDGRFELRVDYKLGEDEKTSTSVLYEEWPGGNPEVSIPFEFFRTDGVAVTSSDFDFEAEWVREDGQTVAQTVADATYGTDGIVVETSAITSGGLGYVKIKLNTIEAGNLKSGVIRLLDKVTKLERNIYVYSIKWFRYREHTLSRIENSTNGYRLKLQLPSGELYSEYPEGLYPIKIKIATKCLRPSGVYNGAIGYTDMTAKDAVVFGVEVRSTGTDVNGINSLGTSGNWDYQNPQWNFWYTYTIDMKEGPCYYIDFTDIRSSYAIGNRPDNVGLYLRIEFFGDSEASQAISITSTN